MEPGQYTDPLEEALSHGSQRVAQFASLAGAMTQVVIQRRALHDARTATRDDERATRALDDQERLIHQQARLSWAPAHDAEWLARADLPQTGRAWASAASYADTDPLAASALRRCEDRLRALHPHAMNRYDRLRTDGLSPLDAMHDAAPLFSRSPDVRVGDPAPARPALTVATGHEASVPAGPAPGIPAGTPPAAGIDKGAELRGREIVARMQASARTAGRPDLGPDELAMILEAATNLPHDVIERITRQTAAKGHARTQQKTGVATSPQTAAGADQPAAVIAAASFPHSIADTVRATPATTTPRRAMSVHRPGNTERLGRPM